MGDPSPRGPANSQQENIVEPEPARTQTEQSVWNLTTVLQVCNTVTSSLELAKTLDATCRAAVELLGVSHSGLVLFDPDQTRGTVQAEYPDIGARGKSIPLRGVPAEEQLLASQKPLMIKDVDGATTLGPVQEILKGLGIRSSLIVPVASSGNLLGSFSLDVRDRTRDFTEQEIELCRVLAAQVAVAIEHAALYEQTRNDARHLEALRRTTLAITSTLDRTELLNAIVRQAVELLGAHSGGIYEFYPERGELKVIADHHRPEYEGQTLKMGQGMAGRLVQSGDPFMIVDDYDQWEGKAPIYPSPRSFGAVLEVPLKWRNEISGVLYVDDQVGRKFTPDDARLLALFADQAAIALANASLAAKDSQKLQRLQTLSQVASEIASNLGTLPLDTRLDLIARRATEILGAEACGILMIKRAGYLSLDASYGHRPDAFHKGREFAITSGPKTGLTGHIAFRGETLNAWGRALAEHPAVRDPSDTHTVSDRCYSLLALPLRKDGELIGLLRVDNKVGADGQPNSDLHFTQEDEWILNFLGEAVVVAIQGADLVAKLAEQRDYISDLVTSSPIAIIANDEHGLVTRFNRRAEEILGYTATEMVQTHVERIYADPEETHRIGKQFRAKDKVVKVETLLKSKTGERIPVRLSATSLSQPHGQIRGAVGFFEDLREVREIERRLDLLLRASNTLTQASDLATGLQSLAELLVTALPENFCQVLLLDEQRQWLQVAAAFPIPESKQSRLQWNPKIGGRIAISEWTRLGELLAQGQPVTLRNNSADAESMLLGISRYLELPAAPQSLLLVPLRTGDRTVGLLNLGEMGQFPQGSFSAEKQELAAAIAGQTAVLIERMRLHELTNRRGQLLEALDQASRVIRAEKETPKLLHQIVRLAAGLVGLRVGGLYLNYPHLQELDLGARHGLDLEPGSSRVLHGEGLIGRVAQTGTSRIIDDYAQWRDREAALEPFHFKTVAAVPLKQIGEVEAVLFVADDAPARPLTGIDIEVLERFAAHAALALQTSQLIGRENRVLGQLSLLHKISDAIQQTMDLDKILQIVLTGVTAGYGLGFNRAALLLLDERREHLCGKMGIGHLNEADARRDWAQHHARGLEDFQRYLKALEEDQLPSTPVGEEIRGLCLPLNRATPDVFSQVVIEHRAILPRDLEKLPEEFKHAFAPATPLAIVPLLVRERVIGVLVADSKFSQTPITDETLAALTTLANSAAIAINNVELLEETQRAGVRLRASFAASNALVSSQDPDQVLQDIVERTRHAAGAAWVSVLLIDATDQVRKLITAGIEPRLELRNLIRSNGLSIQVMRTRVPERIEDVYAERERVSPRMFLNGVAAALCLPLSLRGKPLGVVWIHYSERHFFSANEIDALQFFVNQAAIAYDSARRLKEREYLQQAAQALAGAMGLKQVLEKIVNYALEVMQADSAAIWSYDAVQERFIPEHSVAAGIPEDVWEEFCKVVPRRDGTTATVMKQGWIGVGDIADTERYGFLGSSTRELLGRIGAQSFQGISVIETGEIFGVLYVNYNGTRAFDDEDRAMAQTFANHAALALRNARLLDQVSRAKQAAETVAQVMALGDRQATLRSVAKETRQAVGCDAVTLFTYDAANDRLDYPPTMEGVRCLKLALQKKAVPRDSIVYDMLRRDEPYLVEKIATDDLFRERRFARDEGIESCAAIPLQVAGQKVGVMFVNYRTRHHFTSDVMGDIRLLAYQAAVAIRNTQLFAETRKKVSELTSLYEAGQAITASLELKEILHRIAEQAWHLTTQAGYANIRLVEGDRARVVASFPPEDLHTTVAKLGPEIDLTRGIDGRIGVTGRTIRTGLTQQVPDVSLDPDYLESHARTRSQLTAPLKVGDKVIGVVTVEHPELNAFDAEAKTVLEALAAQAAVAIHNAQLHGETRKDAHALSALYNAGMAIIGTLSLEETLNRIAEQALQVISGGRNSVGCFSHLMLAQGDGLRFVAGSPAETLANLQKSIGILHLAPDAKIGIAGRAVLSGQSKNVANVRGDPDYIEVASQTRSQLSVPLKSDDQTIGVISIEHAETNAFSAKDVQYVELLATEAAVAIRRAQQFTLTQGLLRAGQIVTASGDLFKALQEIADTVRETFACDVVTVYTFNQVEREISYPSIFSGELLEPRARANWKFAESGERLRFDRLSPTSVIRQLLAHDRSHFAVNSETDTVLGAGAFVEREKIRSSAGILLKTESGVVGFLFLNYRRTHYFGPEERTAIEVFATQAALAVESARLYEELRTAKLLVGSRTALAWMGMVSSAWRHAIEGYAVNISGILTLARQDLEQSQLNTRDRKQMEKRLAAIEKEVQRILEKPITPPLSAEETGDVLLINDFIRERIAQLWENEEYADTLSELDLPATELRVRVNPDWFRRALDMLIDNAVTAMRGLPRRVLTIAVRPIEGKVELAVSDTGRGVPPGIAKKLFKEQIEKSEGSTGLGMGLLMVQAIAQSYKGSARLEKTGPAGSTFVLALPLDR